MASRVRARFIEPMLLLRAETLPEGAQWRYELKLDGYRAIAYRSGRTVHLRSRNDNDFSARYASIMQGLAGLPADTVIDGELVAFDEEGRPSFNLLQNAASADTPIAFFVFDLMVLGGRDVMHEPLSVRTALLNAHVLPTLTEPVRAVTPLEASPKVLIASAKAQRFEGLVAKRRDSRYEPGLRSGAWQKMRVNQAQEFVIGGYTIGNPFDALIFGCYRDDGLRYVARRRSGFTPARRVELFKKFRGLEAKVCPFVNLPEPRGGRWGQGLTAKKMIDCRWLQPKLVGGLPTPICAIRDLSHCAMTKGPRSIV